MGSVVNEECLYSSGPDYPRSQSAQHGRHTIGLDARVNLGKAVFGMPTSSSSSSSIESNSQPPKHAHTTALSLVERLGQYRANQQAGQRNQGETLVIDDDDDNTASTNIQKSQTEGIMPDVMSRFASHSLRCPVMNCEVSMKNRRELDEHMEGDHSPCNPCRHLWSGSLRPTLEEYVCPVCLGRYKVSCSDIRKAKYPQCSQTC